MNGMNILLTHEEALVLYEWLASREENANSLQCDEAEQGVIWKIEGQLERMLPDVLMKDYKERVAAAKSIIQRSS